MVRPDTDQERQTRVSFWILLLTVLQGEYSSLQETKQGSSGTDHMAEGEKGTVGPGLNCGFCKKKGAR